MNEEKSLLEGKPLLMEDLSATMQVRTFNYPVRRGFFKLLWVNLTCRHNVRDGGWLMPKHCNKCWTVME